MWFWGMVNTRWRWDIQMLKAVRNSEFWINFVQKEKQFERRRNVGSGTIPWYIPCGEQHGINENPCSAIVAQLKDPHPKITDLNTSGLNLTNLEVNYTGNRRNSIWYGWLGTKSSTTPSPRGHIQAKICNLCSGPCQIRTCIINSTFQKVRERFRRNYSREAPYPLTKLEYQLTNRIPINRTNLTTQNLQNIEISH